MADKFRGNQSSLHSKFMMSQGNWTAWHSNDGFRQYGEMSDAERAKKGWHAGYYVIVVILVYGMSIVMLIASHINRKHQKLLEDRQIDKYLKEFQIVKERSSRDSYRNLKKAIVAKLYRGSSGGGGGGADRSSNSSAGMCGKTGGIYRCISKSILPLTTLAFPSALSAVSGGADDIGALHTISGSRETLQTVKEKTSRNEACLCNLYVIEEFEGEQKRGRSTPPQKMTARYEQHKHRCPRPEPTGRGGAGHSNHQHPVSQKCVTAEINIPPLSNRLSQGSSPELAARYTPVGETAAVDLIVVDQLDSPTDDGRHHLAGEIGQQPQLQKNNDQLFQKQNYSSSTKVGQQCFGDSLSVVHPQRNAATSVKQTHSPKRYLSKSRSPEGVRENHAYGSATGHHADDVARRSSHSSSVCSRHTNPVQISSV